MAATALIVEDNPMNRKLLRDILEIHFTVLEAESAEDAETVLQETIPDLIFLDMQLPGMDGLTFARKLKQNAQFDSIPIVAVSAHAMEENIEDALDAGCREYITKPITEDPFLLAERMAELVRAKS